jgi:hypothetical protein
MPASRAQLRAALKRASIRQSAQQRSLMRSSGDGLILPRAQPSPEHYHVIYHVKNDVSVPDFRRVYISSREVYEYIHDLAQQAEPNVEWYEDGKVGFETRLHGRADLWWVVLEAAACIRNECTKTLERANLKRRLVLLPGETD